MIFSRLRPVRGLHQVKVLAVHAPAIADHILVQLLLGSEDTQLPQFGGPVRRVAVVERSLLHGLSTPVTYELKDRSSASPCPPPPHRATAALPPPRRWSS